MLGIEFFGAQVLQDFTLRLPAAPPEAFCQRALRGGMKESGYRKYAPNIGVI